MSPEAQAAHSASVQQWQLLIGRSAQRHGVVERQVKGRRWKKKISLAHTWSCLSCNVVDRTAGMLWWDLHVAADVEKREGARKCHLPPLLIYTHGAATAVFDAHQDGIWHPHSHRQWSLPWISVWVEKKGRGGGCLARLVFIYSAAYCLFAQLHVENGRQNVVQIPHCSPDCSICLLYYCRFLTHWFFLPFSDRISLVQPNTSCQNLSRNFTKRPLLNYDPLSPSYLVFFCSSKHAHRTHRSSKTALWIQKKTA